MFKAANKESSPAASISATVSASHLSSKAGKLRVTPEGGLSFVGDGGGTGGTGGGGGPSGKSSVTTNQQGGKQKFFASRTSDGKWNLLMAPTSDPSRLFLVQPAPGHKFQVSGGGVRMESVSTASSQSSSKEEVSSSSTSNGCADEHASDDGTSPENVGELAPSTSKSAAASPGLESSTSTSSACPDTPTTSAAALTLTNTTHTAGEDSVKTISPPDHKKPSFFKSRTSREREALKASVGKKVLAVNRRGSKSTSPAAGDNSAKRGKKSPKALKNPKSHSKSTKLPSSLQESMSEIFSLMSVSPEAASSTATTVQSPTPVSTTVTTSSASCTNMVNTMSSLFSSSVTTSVTSSSPTSCAQATSSPEVKTNDTRPDTSPHYISPSSSPSQHQMLNISPPTSPLTGAQSPAQSPSFAVSPQSFVTPPPHPLLTSPESMSSQPVVSRSRSRTNFVDGEVCTDTNSPVLDTKTNSSTDCSNQVSDCRAKTTNSDSAPLQSSPEKVLRNDNEGDIEKQSENSVEIKGTSVSGMDDNYTSEDVEPSLSHRGMPEQSCVPEKDLLHTVSDPPRIDNADDEFDLSAYKPCIDNYGNRLNLRDSDEDDIPLSSLQMSRTDSKENDSADAVLAAAEAADLECQHPRQNSRRSTAAYATLSTDSLNSQHGKEDRKNAKKSVGEKSLKGKQKESKSNKEHIAAEKLPASGSDTDDYEPMNGCKEKETPTLSKRQSRIDSSNPDLSFEFIDTEKFRGKSSPPEKTPEKSDTDMEHIEPLSEKPMTRDEVSLCSESDSQLPLIQDERPEGDLTEDCSQKDKPLGLESEDRDSCELLKEPLALPKRSARAGASDTQDQFNAEVVNSELAVSGKQTKPVKRKKRKSELEVLIASQEALGERAVLENISDNDALPSEDMAVAESHETSISPQESETSEHLETTSETNERESVSLEEKKQKKKKKKKKKALKILINLAESKVKNNLKSSEQSASASVPNSTQEELVPPSETDSPQLLDGSVEDSGVQASGTDTEDQDSSTLTSAPETAPRETKQKKKKKNKKLKIIFGGGQETSTREIPDSASLDCSSRTECDLVPRENVSDTDPSDRDHVTSDQASSKDPTVEVGGELPSTNENTVEPSSVQKANMDKADSSTCGEPPDDSTVEPTNKPLPETDLTSQPTPTQPPDTSDTVEPTSVQPPDEDQIVQPPVMNLVEESGSQQPPKKQRKKRLTELEKIIQDQEALARAEELRLADENSENTDEDNALSENEPEKEHEKGNSQENNEVNELDESAPDPLVDMETSETEPVSQAPPPPPKTKKSEKNKKRKKKKQKDPAASAVTVAPTFPQGTEDISDLDKTSLNPDDSQSTDTYAIPSEAEESNSSVNSDEEDAKTKENRAMAKYLKSRSFTQSQLTEMFGVPFVVLERLSEKDIFFMSRRFRNARVSSRTRCSLHCRSRTLGYLCELKLIECSFRSGIKRAAEPPLSAEGMSPKKKGRPKKAPEEKAEKKKRKKKTNKEGVASGDNIVVSAASSDKGGTGSDKNNAGDKSLSLITVALSKPSTIPPLTPAPRPLLTPVTSISGLPSTSPAGRIVRVAPPLAPAKPSYLMARASAPTPRFISISNMGTSGPSSLPQIISLPPLVASTTGTSRIIIPPIMATTTTTATIITTATATTPSSSSSSSLKDSMRASLTQAITNSLHKANLVPATTVAPTTTSSSLLNSTLISALSTGPAGAPPKQFFVVQMGDKRVLVPATALSTTAATTTPPAATISSTPSQPKVIASVQRPVTTAAGGTSTISTVVMGPNTPLVSSGTRPPPPLVPGSVARIVLSNRRPPVPTSTVAPRTRPTASTLLFSGRRAQRNQAWIGPRPTQASIGPRVSTTAGSEKRILVSPASQPQGIRVVISGPGSITPGSRFTVASSRGGGVFLASRSATSLVRLPVGPSRPGKRVMTEEERLRKRARLEKKYPLPPGVVIKTEATTFGYGDEGKTVSSGSSTSARMIVSSLQQGGRTSVNLNTPIPVISANRGNPIIIRQASPGASSGVRPSSSLLGPLIIRVPNPTTSSSSGTTARVAVSSSNFTASLLPSGARLTTTITNTTGHVFSLLSGTSSRPATATSSGVSVSTGSTRLTASTYVSTSSTVQNSASRVGLLAPPTTSVTSVVSTSASSDGVRNVAVQDDDDVYIVDSPSPRSEISHQGEKSTQSQPKTPSSASSSTAVSSNPQVVISSSSPSVVTGGSVSSSIQATTIPSTIVASSVLASDTAISVSSASDPVSAVPVSTDVPTEASPPIVISSSTQPPFPTTSSCLMTTSLSLPDGATISTSLVSTCASHSLTTTNAPLSSALTATSLLRGTPSRSFSSPSSPVPSASIASSRMASLGAMLARQATESGSLPSIDTSSLQSERLRRLKEALAKQMVNVSDDRRQRVLQALARQMSSGSRSRGAGDGDGGGDEVNTGGEEQGRTPSYSSSAQNDAQQNPAQTETGSNHDKQPATDSEVVVVLDESDEREETVPDQQSGSVPDTNISEQSSAPSDVESTVGSPRRDDTLDPLAVVKKTDSSAVSDADKMDQGAENDVVILDHDAESTVKEDAVVDGDETGKSDQSIADEIEMRSSADDVEERAEEQSAVNVVGDEEISGSGDVTKTSDESETPSTTLDKQEETTMETEETVESVSADAGQTTDSNTEAASSEAGGSAIVDDEGIISSGQDGETNYPVPAKESHTDDVARDRTVSDAGDSGVTTSTKPAGGEDCVEIINLDDEQL